MIALIRRALLTMHHALGRMSAIELYIGAIFCCLLCFTWSTKHWELTSKKWKLLTLRRKIAWCVTTVAWIQRKRQDQQGTATMAKPKQKRKLKYPIDPEFVTESEKKSACMSYKVKLVEEEKSCRSRATKTVPKNLEVNVASDHLDGVPFLHVRDDSLYKFFSCMQLKRSPKGGKGVFVKSQGDCNIPPKTFLGNYEGTTYSRGEWEKAGKNGDYCFANSRNRDAGKKLVDGRALSTSNYLRFVNHSYVRKTSKPNCRAVDGHQALYFVTTKWVKGGEELLVNYGRDYWKGREAPK